MNATVRVKLLGRDYMLRSQGDPDRVQEAATLVEEKLAGLTESVSVDTRDRFMLVMLNLAGEYLQERRDRQSLECKLEILQTEQLNAEKQLKINEAELIERIENALHD